MITELTWNVPAGAAGERLDRHVLGEVPSSNRALVSEAVAAGLILVNNRRCQKGARVEGGDVIFISKLAEEVDLCVLPDKSVKFDVVHEDKAFLVLNKPAGIPTHPLKRMETGTLANGLVARYPELSRIGDDPLFPSMVHRLDTDTSGIVLAARTAEAYENLRRQFAGREVEKVYVAAVHGASVKGGRLENDLMHNPRRRGQMLVADGRSTHPDEERFRAVSVVKVRKQFASAALVEVVIRTGITHQIRCQLAHAGYPILGDEVYGERALDRKFGIAAGRHLLHAESISFVHPVSGESSSFCVDPPSDFRSVISDIVAG